LSHRHKMTDGWEIAWMDKDIFHLD
jgi:hypothetical protein